MKRILAFIMAIALALPLMQSCGSTSAIGRRHMNKAAVNNLVRNYSNRDGFDVVSVGGMGLSLMKLGARVANIGSSNSKSAIKMISGLKSLRVVDYSNASEYDRNTFDRKLERYLGNTDVLMESREGGDITRIYGIVPEDGSKIEDLVVYDPTSSTLVCLFGTFDIDQVRDLIAKD